MFDLDNKSRFAATLLPTMEVDGGEAVLVIVKGAYTLKGGRAHLAEEQVPPVMADQYFGEPGESSLRYASDLAPEKRGTDVVLIGSAYPPSGQATELDVILEAGSLRKTIRVFGDRKWTKSLFSTAMTKPVPFMQMPLVYERAFGGVDKTHKKESEWAFEARNPIGRGLIANTGRPDFAEVPLPNLEDPAALITKPQDRPAPVGFGFLAASWEPRKKHAGTYDDAWLNGRCPLLPADFDARFHNAAHPDLVSKEYFRGGESVHVTNVRKEGSVSFRVPMVDVKATFFIDGTATERPCTLDTIIIEPDEQRLLMTWRARVRCHRKIKYVTGARVTSAERGI